MSSHAVVRTRGGAGGRGTDPAAVERAHAALPGPEEVARVAEVFDLLADPGRLRLLVALRGADLCVGDLAAAVGLSESATSHALRILRANHVVRARRSGRLAYYALADDHIVELLDLALAHVGHEVDPDGRRGSRG